MMHAHRTWPGHGSGLAFGISATHKTPYTHTNQRERESEREEEENERQNKQASATCLGASHDQMPHTNARRQHEGVKTGKPCRDSGEKN